MVTLGAVALALIGLGDELRVTTFEKPWQDRSAEIGGAVCGAAATVKLERDRTDQTVIGFGTAMSELSHEGRIFEGEDGFVCDDAHMRAYALYFRRYVESYRAKGIPLWMVMPQNEFNSDQNFPSCTWSVGQLAKFIGRYLGPALEGSGVELHFGTLERPNPDMLNAVLERPAYAKYVTGAGFQWAGKDALPRVRARYPKLTYVMSEQECGDGQNDWQHALHCWDLMLHYFNHGVSVYDYWNLALQKDGLSHWGWRQNSLVVVDAATRTAVFTPEYHVLKHLSHYVRRGAGAFCNGRRLAVSAQPLEDGVVVFGTSPYHEDLSERSFKLAYALFRRSLDVRRSGSAALDLCAVAAGRAELFFELILAPWDYAAGALIVQEAGGTVTTVDGVALAYDHPCSVFARGTGIPDAVLVS